MARQLSSFCPPRNLVGFFFAALFLTLPGAAQATTVFMHGWHDNTNLYTVDTVTGTETLIGSTGIRNMGGLSFSGDGVLYGIDIEGNLYTINPGNAATNLIGDTGLSAPSGLSFANDGTTLYAPDAQAPGSLFSINPANAVAVLLGATGLTSVDGLSVAPVAVNTIAGSFAAGTIFAVDGGNLYAISPNTLAVTFLGNAGSAVVNESLVFDADGTLYGHNFEDTLSRINLLTFAGTPVASTSGPITGLAIKIKVPEPTTLLLLGLGLAGFGFARRH